MHKFAAVFTIAFVALGFFCVLKGFTFLFGPVVGWGVALSWLSFGAVRTIAQWRAGREVSAKRRVTFR